MELFGSAQIRELANRLNITPTKRRGQNFMVDPNTVRKIVRLAGVGSGQYVLEIGSGLGSLTLGLLATGAHVVAVEIDTRLAAALPDTVSTMHAAAAARLRVVCGDALELTAAQLRASDDTRNATGAQLPQLLVANLPYNVAVPILMRALDALPDLRAGLVLVQAEVGRRLAAVPGTKTYGAPSAKAAWYGSWQLADPVSRRAFWPVPGVDSVLVAFQRAHTPRGGEHERVRTFALVQAAFASRRKMLRQALLGAPGLPSRPDELREVLLAAGVEPTARAEQLGIDDFLRLARACTV